MLFSSPAVCLSVVHLCLAAVFWKWTYSRDFPCEEPRVYDSLRNTVRLNKMKSHYSLRMKVLLFAPVFAMVAIGLVYGDACSKDKDGLTPKEIIGYMIDECAPKSLVTLFISHIAASIIQDGT